MFSSTAYYHVKESKLDPRAKKALFMGITSGIKGFRLWCPETKKVIFRRDVTFDESPMLKKLTNEAVQTCSTPQKEESTLKQVEFERMTISPTKEAKAASNPPEAKEESYEVEVLTQEPLQQLDSILKGRPRREIRRPARFTDMVAYALPMVDEDVPSNFQEASRSSESGKWKKAMDEEMQSLQKNKTWKMAQLPKGKEAIGANGYTQRKKDFLTKVMFATKQDWWQKATLRRKELTTMRYFLQL